MIRASILTLFFVVSQIGFATESYLLKAPVLTEESVLAYNVGLRPYRTSGMRIELEKLGGKTIIQKHGHGGAGITLSWGSAKEAVQLMHAHDVPCAGATIAVIGAGVMGLSVANQLLDLGYKVRVYAQDFEDTTSIVAAGLWDPFGISVPERGPAKEQFERVKHVSHDFFHELATVNSPRYAGVSYKDAFLFFEKEDEREHKYPVVDVQFENGLKKQAEKTQLMLIGTPMYMRELANDALRKGAVFVPHIFKNTDDVVALNEDLIFNCAGFGSRQIFGDMDLIPIRGQLVYVKKTQDVDYFAWAATPKESQVFFFTFPYKDKLIIGGSYEKAEELRETTPEIRTQIMENARRFFATGRAQRDEL